MADTADRRPLLAAAVDVPLLADNVAPPRLVYGSLNPSLTGRDDNHPALYFEIAGLHSLGRVTFEGLDAVRACRGETLPYGCEAHHTAPAWVFTVAESPWLAERHRYEMERYETPLLQTHQHYVFKFHDEFVEAIAGGIWLDVADAERPFSCPARHPLARLGPGLPCEKFESASGIRWELWRSPWPDGELIRRSSLCSQRVYQLNMVDQSGSSEAASVWLRTRDGRTTSQLIQPWQHWTRSEMGRWEGLASPADFTGPWEQYLAQVAERRRGQHSAGR